MSIVTTDRYLSNNPVLVHDPIIDSSAYINTNLFNIHKDSSCRFESPGNYRTAK